jgi:hydrogenase maturation factor
MVVDLWGLTVKHGDYTMKHPGFAMIYMIAE